MHQINIAVLDFLGGPPPEGTQQVELSTQQVPGEEATSSDPALDEEVTKVIEVVDSEEDFEVFD